MGGGSGQKTSASSSSTVDPLQQEFLKELYFGALTEVSGRQNAQGQSFGGKLKYFPDSTVAGESADTLTARQAQRDLFNGGGGFSALQGEGYNADVLAGKYLSPDSNPFLRGTYDNAAKAVSDNYNRNVMPNIASRFARSGQSLSSGLLAAQNRSQDVLGDDLRRLATDIYGQNYQQERGRQETARTFAPNYEDQYRERIQGLEDAGSGDSQFRQRVLDDLIERFEFDRDEPFTRLARFSELIGRPTNVDTSRSRSSSKSVSFFGG